MEVQLHELTPVLSPADQEAMERQQQQRQQRQLAMSDTRRALVLDAARSVFAEKGVEGASIREIARRAGYTPSAHAAQDRQLRTNTSLAAYHQPSMLRFTRVSSLSRRLSLGLPAR